jgi:N4-gp56 family major capsid protein
MVKITTNLYSGGDSTALSRYFDKVVIEALLPNTYILNAGTQKVLPKGQNKYVFSLATKSVGTVAGLTLTEGTTPTEGSWAMEQQEVSLTQIGEYIIMSDIVLQDSPVEIIANALSDIAMNVAAVADILVQDVIDAGTNVYYSNDATSRVTIGSNDTLAAANISKAQAILLANNAKPYDGGMFMGVIHPHVLHDLRIETGTGAWLDANKYVTPEKIFKGEIGALSGVRMVVSPNLQFYANASDGSGSTGTIDVYPTYFFGKDAYGVVREGEPQSVFNPLGSSGSADPLKQRASAGVKFRVGATILRENALVRFESYSTLGTNA